MLLECVMDFLDVQCQLNTCVLGVVFVFNVNLNFCVHICHYLQIQIKLLNHEHNTVFISCCSCSEIFLQH